jgi:hypothetical protein
MAWWTDTLFIVGSACFAAASIPALAEAVPAAAIGTIYFVGSVFFTSAGYLQLRQALPRPGGYRWLGTEIRSAAWWAAAVQSAGTLWFNLNTFEAMATGLTAQEQDLRIWTPDVVGSICFLVSSTIAVLALGPGLWPRHRTTGWRVAATNLLGSVFFMLSAIAAFVLPSTEDLLDASVANTGTLLGALCFLGAAAVDRRALRTPAD